MKDFWRSEADQKKFHLLARQICDLMVSNFGPKASILYLPSQIASAAVQMAMKKFFTRPDHGTALSEEELATFIGENSKIVGYSSESTESVQ